MIDDDEDEFDEDDNEDEVEIVVAARRDGKMVKLISGVLIDRANPQESRKRIREMVALLQDSIPEASLTNAAQNLTVGPGGALMPDTKKKGKTGNE